jgi:hypothetical protein
MACAGGELEKVAAAITAAAIPQVSQGLRMRFSIPEPPMFKYSRGPLSVHRRNPTFVFIVNFTNAMTKAAATGQRLR